MNIKSTIIAVILIVITLLVPINSQAQFDFRDSDGDGITNNLEDNIAFTEKNNFDTDGDGYGDGYEYFFKFSGGNPLDPNKYPEQLTTEEDADGDGIRDMGFDISSFVLGQTLTVLGSSNILEPTCTLDVANVQESEYSPLNCSYPLKGGNNNGYFFAFEGYNASLELSASDLSSDCFILNNNTAHASLECLSIPYKNAVLNTQKIILTRTVGLTNNREQLTANKSIDIVNLGDQLLTSTLSFELDNLLAKSCVAVDPLETTSCSFQLPALTTLPLNYKIGVGTVPGGNCNADENGLVVCDNVPTSSQGLVSNIKSNTLSTLGDNTLQTTKMLAVNTNTYSTYDIEIDSALAFPVIKDLNTTFEGAVNLTFVGDNSINLGRIESGIFTPIDPGSYPKFDPNTSLQGVITAENGVGSNIGPIVKLNIKVLQPRPNITKTEVIAKPTSINSLSRTGGDQSTVISIVFSVVFLLISNYFIFFKKPKSIALCSK